MQAVEIKIQPEKIVNLSFSQYDSKCNTAFYGYYGMKDMHASTLER